MIGALLRAGYRTWLTGQLKNLTGSDPRFFVLGLHGIGRFPKPFMIRIGYFFDLCDVQ